MLEQETLNRAKEVLIRKINPHIIYLFGSAVKGPLRADSDVDIAFVGGKGITNYETFMLAQELAEIIGREVDLIDLEKASTVFRAQAVGSGEVIYSTDEIRRQYLEMYALADYARLNEERAVVLRRIKESGSVYG